MVINGLYRMEDKQVETLFSFDEEVLKKALKNIYSKDFHPMTDIEENLFEATWKTMNKATDKGFGTRKTDDPDYDFYREIRMNNAVFAAFKVHRAQNDMAALLLDKNGSLKPFEQWVKEAMPIADHQMIHWLRTEYDTAVIRAHQAADWRQFEREKDVLPNLKWMPSTSIHPGADHRIFWGTIRPIDDPFWNEHKPGDRWNCKCTLSSTDEAPTAVPDENGQNKAHDGLENNPGKDGKLFSDKHPYVTEAHPGAKKAVDALTRRINEMIAEMPDNLTLEEKTDIACNNLKIEKALGVTKGKPMTYEQANKGKENPKFGKEEGYRVNCQTCTVTHMLRRLGFDIEAKPNIRQSAYNEMAKQGITWEERFLNRDGTKPDYDYTYKWQVRKGYQVMNANRLKEYFREKFREDGIYEIYCAWKGGSAHVFCAEVTEGKTRFFDPQTGKDDASNYIQSMKAGRVGVIRIDNKLVNPKIMGLFITK